MFDIGTSELLVVGAVALIVIGPKDLPEVFRQLGRFTAKARAMGREFTRAMEQAANETGVKDVAKDLNKIANPKTMGISGLKDAADKFEKWDPMANAAKPSAPLSASTIRADEDEDFSVTAFDEAAADASAHGPETQALLDKQAARKAVIEESTAKLKAIDAGGAEAKLAAKPRKSRGTATKPAAKAAAPKPAPKTAPKTAPKSAAKAPAKTASKPAAKPASRARKTPSTTAKS